MPYRTFADGQGRSWEIWDVRPERIDRRADDRRAERPTPWTGPERRQGADRRRQSQARTRILHPLAEGWLVFKSDGEKRRLAPIPPNWENCRGRELHDLWARATVITQRETEKSA